MNRTLTRVAMTTAGIMIAHQVAAKAFRDAAFLRAWPVSALPMMTLASVALTAAIVPLFSGLIARFSPAPVVAAGFALSAFGHAAEWGVYDSGPFEAVVIYLHLAVVGAVLLSGFWAIVAERYDPAGARESFGRIAASGTAGGIAGSFAAERIASLIAPQAILVMLAGLHVLCAIGVGTLWRVPAVLPRQADEQTISNLRDTLRNRYVRTIAMFVVLTSATAIIIDFLLKTNARLAFGTGPELLRFFAVFYGTVQVATFLGQTGSARALRRFGVGGTISILPGGVGAASALALMAPGWPVFTALRATETVLRNSLFRSGYELLFVPMEAATRRRAKAILDVACDRAGEAVGSGIIQLLLAIGIVSISSNLLRIAIVLSIAAAWIGQRFAALYLDVVEEQLVKHREAPPVSMVSEAGWTIVQLPAPAAPPRRSSETADKARREITRVARVDPQLDLLTELRSGDVARVTASLGRAAAFDRIHVAETISLLAWDAVLPAARAALEQRAPSHLGMLIDAMLDPATDFTIRRRLPRILGEIASPRSLDGLISGLNDSRFEVRYHCSRAINRILGKNDALSVDRARIIAVVEHELAVPPQMWRGYRLLDRPDDPPPSTVPAAASSRQVEYIFLLLSTIIAREPLDAAVHGVRSPNAGVRGLAIEYLDQVLPPAVLERLRSMIEATASDGDVPEQSGQPPTAR